MHTKQWFADLLFGVRLACAFALCGSQFVRFFETTAGQSVVMLSAAALFLTLNVVLASGAHRAAPTRLSSQMVWAYRVWLALLASNIGVILYQGDYRWSEHDSLLLSICAGGTSGLGIFALAQGLSLRDSMLKSLMAMLYKAVPQFVMAVKIADEGGAGVPALAVWSGNLSICLRILQTWLKGRQSGWSRDNAWLFANEVANELSWIAVTVVWLVVG